MTTLSPGVASALDGLHVVEFHALELVLPSYTLRLIDGAGFVTFGGNTFVGRDPTYGTIGAIESFDEGVENKAPRLTVTLLPPTNTAAALLANPAAQGGAARLWYGVLNPETGLPVDDPHLEFVGEIDVPVLKVGRARALEIEVSSIWEKLFPRDDGARLNNAFHQSIWPGELGFEFVVDVQGQNPWGQDGPRPAAVRDIPNAGAGPGGFYGEFARRTFF